MSAGRPLKVLDAFAGIGGFSLGLERTGGFITEAFIESDPFCRSVLNKHWPEIPVYNDIRKFYKFADDYPPCADCDEPYCELCGAHLKALGNAVIPEVVEQIGRRILDARKI
jgi:site-specific DNA-cytosine methylase